MSKRPSDALNDLLSRQSDHPLSIVVFVAKCGEQSRATTSKSVSRLGYRSASSLAAPGQTSQGALSSRSRSCRVVSGHLPDEGFGTVKAADPARSAIRNLSARGGGFRHAAAKSIACRGVQGGRNEPRPL